MKRRSFVKAIAGAVLLVPLLQYCKDQTVKALVRLTGTSHILGHRLWAKDFPEPSHTQKTKYLIVGGGVTGLSAARELTKKGISDFIVVELEEQAGGNSSSGQNKYSRYPLGAHYLPLPNLHDKELISFLEEEKIITGYSHNGKPLFDEEQLTFSPQERLYYKNTWQEGLVPSYGNSNKLDEEFERFFGKMQDFQQAKGTDGKFIFDIPLAAGSADKAYRELDLLTMKEWLYRNNFKHDELFEYVNYCCRDDFGLGVEYVSAWAGIHYFASRKHNSAERKKENVLTWPEGNARLVSHLKKYTAGKTLPNHIVYDVAIGNNHVKVLAYDNATKQSVTFTAEKVLMCTPQFVNQYLISGRKKTAAAFVYAPWLLATLILRNLPDGHGYPLSWDNVIFKGKGLGYIYNQHQNVGQIHEKKVITYYYSFSTGDSSKARKGLYRSTKEQWQKFVLDDLAIAHPLIRDYAEDIEIHLLGHGMISPVPGFMFSEAKGAAAGPIDDKIYFAHTDLAGISIFEEAFHQGINAVTRMLK